MLPLPRRRHTSRPTYGGLAVLLTVMFSTGCNPTTQTHDEKRYRTIPTQIGRQADQAREQTAIGAALLEAAEATRDLEGAEASYGEALAQAEQCFRAALDADIMYGPAHNNLGRVFYLQGRYYEAAWEFQYAAQLMPHRPIPRNNLGLVFEATGQLDKAEEHYALALAAEPDNPEFLGNLARARVRRGERSNELLDLLQEVVAKDDRPAWRSWAEQQQRYIAARIED